MNTTKLRRAVRLAKRHGVLVAFREWYRFHMARGHYSRDMACDIALWDLELGVGADVAGNHGTAFVVAE